MWCARGVHCKPSVFFIMYVNDTVQNVSCDLFLYGDDSTLLVSGKSQTEIERTLSLQLKSLCGWVEESKLSSHLGKK